MGDQTNEQREALAIGLAREEGRRQQVVDSRLAEHDGRLDAINGSMLRAAEGLERLGGKVDAMADAQRLRAALEEQRAKDIASVANSQVSKRNFNVAAFAVFAPLMYDILHNAKVL